ncbi:MAG: CatA-like O-acetyltransferase [Bacilli bacterium]|nr:CatA-like O-acetyltransferase [Bacilli bacterium]
MKTLVKDYDRKELFEYFNSKTNPFSFVTTKLDITKVYKYSRTHKNLYVTLCYLFTRAINKVDAFLYAYESGNFIKYDSLSPSYTEKLDNGNVAFISLNMADSLEEFIESCKLAKQELKNTQKDVILNDPEKGAIWYSCLPWFKFTGVVPPYDAKVTVPQIIWDQFEIVEGHVYINAMIMAHHGFIDGSHIGLLIKSINEEFDKIGE